LFGFFVGQALARCNSLVACCVGGDGSLRAAVASLHKLVAQSLRCMRALTWCAALVLWPQEIDTMTKLSKLADYSLTDLPPDVLYMMLGDLARPIEESSRVNGVIVLYKAKKSIVSTLKNLHTTSKLMRIYVREAAGLYYTSVLLIRRERVTAERVLGQARKMERDEVSLHCPTPLATPPAASPDALRVACCALRAARCALRAARCALCVEASPRLRRAC
jgi:hypothetical protein